MLLRSSEGRAQVCLAAVPEHHSSEPVLERPTSSAVIDLRRSLGFAAAAAFVVTNMIGSGIFTVPAFVRVATGSALGSLGIWAAGALLGLSGALCYAELATRMPGAGGEYRYLSRVFGPLWGFLSGWTSFVVGFSAAVAASSLGMMAYVAPLIPGWQSDAPVVVGWPVSQAALGAAGLVAMLTVLHCIGVRSSSRFQTTLAAVVLVGIAVFVVAGLSTGAGSAAGLRASTAGQSSWWVALLQVSFAYSGWNAAAYMAGEVSEPRRNLPRALLLGTAVVAVVYLALNALFFYALPEAEWQADIAVGQVAAERLFGHGGALAVSALIAFAMFGSVSAMIAVGPRIYFAMARDQLAPSVLARISASGRVPRIAIVAQGVLAALLALTGSFGLLLTYIGSALLLFAGLTVAALFVVRLRDGAPGEAVFATPLFPLPALVFVGITVAAWANGLVDAPLPTFAALGTMLLGAAVYALGRQLGWLGVPGDAARPVSHSG